MITNVKFQLQIDSGNAAMVEDPEAAIRRILEGAIRNLGDLNTGFDIRDANGNKVGFWWIATENEENDDDE